MNIKVEQASQLRDLFNTAIFKLFLELLEDYQVETTNKLINAPPTAPSYGTYVAHLTGVIKGLEHIQKIELTLDNIVKRANDAKLRG